MLYILWILGKVGWRLRRIRRAILRIQPRTPRTFLRKRLRQGIRRPRLRRTGQGLLRAWTSLRKSTRPILNSIQFVANSINDWPWFSSRLTPRPKMLTDSPSQFFASPFPPWRCLLDTRFRRIFPHNSIAYQSSLFFPYCIQKLFFFLTVNLQIKLLIT